MNNIFDALEISLQELEDGTELDVVLGHFPDFADELRPILETSIKARGIAVSSPSPAAVRRGRAKVLQHAAELRESRIKPGKRVIPIFQRLAMSLGLVVLFLTSGTGLVNASSSALPGENLYPVKRTWEDIQLLFVFDEHERNLLKYEFEDERLNEVSVLMSEGRHETIQIAGVFMVANGNTYISGIPVIIPSNLILPGNGTSVLITGKTNANGFVEVITIESLPDGSVVPLGAPIEVESESNGDSEGSSLSPVNESSSSEIKYYSMEGILQSVNSTSLVVNNKTVLLDSPKINGNLCVGSHVELKGYFADDGTFMVTEVDAEGSCPSTGSGIDNNSNTNKNNNSNTTDDGSDDNSGNGSNSGSSNENESNSGSGGGDDNLNDSSGSGGGGDDNKNSNSSVEDTSDHSGSDSGTD